MNAFSKRATTKVGTILFVSGVDVGVDKADVGVGCQQQLCAFKVSANGRVV
jgi:hypothetical protein